MLEKRVNLFGVRIDDSTLRRAALLARKSILSGERRSFFTPNLQMLSRAREDEKIKELLNSASVSLPDGFSLKILAKISGRRIENTVPGIDFGEALLKIAEKEGARVFLLGGKRGVAKRAAKKLLEKHPRLKICGAFHGYFKHCQAEAVCKMIEKSGADVLIVCQGFPRQEKFARLAMQKARSVKAVACLGGSLDVWAGDKERAPECLRDCHLEWLWRIANEPSRCAEFIKSLDLFPVAFKGGLEKILSCGIKEQKQAYNQTDIL